LRQIKDWCDGRDPVAPGLLAGGDGDVAPVLDATFGALAGKPDHAALCRYRLDADDAQFDGLLHHQIHLVAGGQRLHQRQHQRGFRVAILECFQRRA
jgi:hypothetical protein